MSIRFYHVATSRFLLITVSRLLHLYDVNVIRLQLLGIALSFSRLGRIKHFACFQDVGSVPFVQIRLNNLRMVFSAVIGMCFIRL